MNLNSKNIKKDSSNEKEEDDENENQEQEEVLAPEEQEDKRKLIIILEKACLETGKLNKKIELLNCDEHRKFISTKLKRDYSTYRPDITHQVSLI